MTVLTSCFEEGFGTERSFSCYRMNYSSIWLCPWMMYLDSSTITKNMCTTMTIVWKIRNQPTRMLYWSMTYLNFYGDGTAILVFSPCDQRNGYDQQDSASPCSRTSFSESLNDFKCDELDYVLWVFESWLVNDAWWYGRPYLSFSWKNVKSCIFGSLHSGVWNTIYYWKVQSPYDSGH